MVRAQWLAQGKRKKNSEKLQKYATNCAPQTLECPRKMRKTVKTAENCKNTAGNFLHVPVGVCH